MSVPKPKRSLSKMEFYHYGLKICRYIFAVLKREFSAKEGTPDWCIDLAREEIFKTLYSLMREITFANDTYIVNKETYMERRNHITRAIGYCDYLLVQLTLVGELFNFDYDKYEYIIDGRKIICTMSPDTITRERRKLKKYAKRVKNHQMSIDDFKHSYRCWRGSKKEYKCYRSLKNMDELYKALLKELKNETENFGFD